MCDVFDNIKLFLPFKAEYVIVARLTASGVASRIGFDIDTIEDIKVAVSEVCNKFVNLGSKIANDFTVIFNVGLNKLTITFDCNDKSLRCIFDENDEFGVSIITALMDEVEFHTENDYIFSISKVLEETK